MKRARYTKLLWALRRKDGRGILTEYGRPLLLHTRAGAMFYTAMGDVPVRVRVTVMEVK